MSKVMEKKKMKDALAKAFIDKMNKIEHDAKKREEDKEQELLNSQKSHAEITSINSQKSMRSIISGKR